MIAANSPSAVQAVKRQISATHRRPRADPRGAGAGAGRCGARQPAFRRGHGRVPREAPAAVLMTTTRPQSRTLGDLVDELAAATPQAPALVSGAERLDFAAPEGADRRLRPRAARSRHRPRRSGGVAVLEPHANGWWPLSPPPSSARRSPPSARSRTPRELAWTLEHSGARGAGHAEPFRGRRFLGALRELCPELARLPPGRACRARGCRPCAPSSSMDGAASPGTFGAGGVPGARRRRRCAALAARAGGGRAGRHLLHPLHLGLHRRAQGRDPGARAVARQRLRHRRAAAPDGRGPAVAGGAAVLVVRLGQRDAGDHDPWRLHRAAGELRAGRGAGA